MKRLLEAFSLFVHDHPEFTETESKQLARQLQMLMDSDPEKIVLRQALEYYANEYNWPYEMHSPDGITITGMEVVEATQIAQNALRASDQLKNEIMTLMLDGKSNTEVLRKSVKSG